MDDLWVIEICTLFRISDVHMNEDLEETVIIEETDIVPETVGLFLSRESFRDVISLRESFFFMKSS